MKKSTLTLSIAAMAMALVITSCSKPEPKTLIKQTVTKFENFKSIVDYEYDENGALLTETTTTTGEYGSTNKNVYEYDENNRLISLTCKYDGSPSNKETYTYNENGDTLTYMSSFYNDGSWEVMRKIMFTYDDEGKLSHKYVCSRYGAEGEGEIEFPNLLDDFEYDKNGNLVARTYYNPDYEHGSFEYVDLSDKTSGSFRTEFQDYVRSYVLDGPTKETYTYNAQGKLAGVKSNGKPTCTLTYDANGNLQKKHTTYIWTDEYFCDETFSYDNAGRLLTHKTAYSTESENIKTYKYNEKGDTLEIIETVKYDGAPQVNSKVRYEYSPETGKLTAKYCFGLTDDYGHDSMSFDKYAYNEDGTLAKYTCYSPNFETVNYEDIRLKKEFDGDGTAELTYYKGKYSLKESFSTTYSHITIEEDTSILGTIKKKLSDLFGGIFGSKTEQKSKSDIEYDI